MICQYYLPANDSSRQSNSSAEIKDEKNQTELIVGEGSCDIGWTLNDNYCYKFFETNQTFVIANVICLKNNANLVSISSEAEQMWVQNFLFTISGALEAVWLGKIIDLS